MFNQYVHKIICAGIQAQYDTAKSILESGETTYSELYDYLVKFQENFGYPLPEDYYDILDMLEGWCDSR